MTTKLRIDLSLGVLEVEGTEQFVSSIYDDFKDRMKGVTIGAKADFKESPGVKRDAAPSEMTGVKVTKKRKGAVGKTMPNIVKDLDLAGSGNTPRLKDFYNQFNPKSNYERNLIFVYYLNHNLGLSGITLDHIFTCYRDVPGLKAPSLQQSLWDTSKHKGWVDTSDGDDITVTRAGMNYLEHDMERVTTDE